MATKKVTEKAEKGADYKAAMTFSFDGKVYNEGDAVNVTDETAIDKLLERGHIAKGKGKVQEPAPANTDTYVYGNKVEDANKMSTKTTDKK
jgi:hypothetical protein